VTYVVNGVGTTGAKGKRMIACPNAPRLELLLSQWNAGDSGSRDELLRTVYGDIRRMAERLLRAKRAPGDARSIAHDVLERLLRRTRTAWASGAHFWSNVSLLIRSTIIDRHRARCALKRGGNATKVSATDVDLRSSATLDLARLEDLMNRLAVLDRRRAAIFDRRFLRGQTIEETANELQLSPATIKRESRVARSWMSNQLGL